MADMTLEQAMKTVTPEVGYQPYDNTYLAVQEKERLKETRANASFFEGAEAFGTRFAESNMLVEWVRRATAKDYEPDQEFIDNNSDERVQEIVDANMFTPDEGIEIRKAQSVWEEGEIIQGLIEKREKNKFAQDKLSEGWQTAGSVSGAIIDIDTAIIGPLAGIMGKGKKTMDIGKTTFKIESAGAVLKSNINDDYDLLKDGILDVIVGTAADTAIAKHFSNAPKLHIEQARENAIINQQAIDSFVAEVGEHIDNRVVLDEQVAKAQAKKLAEKARIEQSNTLVKQEIQKLKDIEEDLTNSAQKRAEASRLRIEKSNELVKQEIQKLKDIEKDLTNSSKQRAEASRLRIEKSNELIRLENEARIKLEGEMDAKYRTRVENKVQLQAERQARFEKQIEDISKNLIPEVNKLKAKVKLIADDFDEVSRADAIREIDDVITELGKKFPEETQALTDLFSRVKDPTFKSNPLKLTAETLGQVTDSVSKKMPKKKKAVMLGALLAGTAAMADDDTDTEIPLAGIMALGVATYVLGGEALKLIRNNQLRDTVKKFSQNIKNTASMAEYKASDSGSKTLAYVNGLHNKMNTAFNSTFQEIIGYKDEIASKLAHKLLLNPLDGKVETADVEKMQMLRGEQAKVAYALKAGFRQFIDSKQITNLQFGEVIAARAEFNKLVSRAVEGEDILEPGVKEAAKEINTSFKTALDYAKEVGVYGADSVRGIKNYLPRMWKFNTAHEIIKGTDDAGRRVIARQLAKMIKGPDSYTQAEKFVEWLSSNKNFKSNQADDILNRLEEFLKENYDEAAAKSALQTQSEMGSRLKSRVDMDLSKFDEVTVNINGIDKKITLDDFIERDIQNVSDMYLNQMYGQIALAKRGYSSVKQLRDEINTIANVDASNALHTVVDLILGQPLSVNNKGTHEVAMAVKGITFTAVLPLVAFSMVPEALKAVSNAGFSRTLQNFTNLFKTMNQDSELFKTLTELTGLGTHSIRDRLDLKGIDNADLGELGVNSWAAKASVKGQETLARLSGLVKLSDVFQRLTLLKSTTDFANFVAGKANDIPLARMESYGITDDLKEMFKGDFKFSDKGELLAINSDKWSYAKRTKFNDIVFRLNQEITPEVALGTTGRWTKDTDIGRMFSFLISYPINLYANQAIKDAKYMDYRAAQNTLLTFAGTYIGLAAKYEAMNKDYEHEDLVMYSLMNLPSMAIIGAIRGLSDPATVSYMSGIKDDVDALASGTIDTAIGGQ